MPVRSLSSSVLKWPDARTVEQAARAWAQAEGQARPEVWRIGYFGSYARGDWGVGSDLDVLILVNHSELPFADRSAARDLLALPVPAEALVYTRREWQAMAREGGRFYRTLLRETKWIYQRAPTPDPPLAEEETDAPTRSLAG